MSDVLVIVVAVCKNGTIESDCSNACNSTCMERSLDSCVFSGKCEMGCKCENDSVSFFFILITQMHTFAMYSLANLSLLL